MDEREVFEIIDSSNLYRKGDYLNNLKAWYSVFDEEQIFLGYLEEVKGEPDQLLKRILTHIGVDDPSTTHFQESMEDPSHVGQVINIEPKYESFLREKYYKHNEELYELLGNPIIKNWNNWK